jgi:hypothetical protein
MKRVQKKSKKSARRGWQWDVTAIAVGRRRGHRHDHCWLVVVETEVSRYLSAEERWAALELAAMNLCSAADLEFVGFIDGVTWKKHTFEVEN